MVSGVQYKPDSQRYPRTHRLFNNWFLISRMGVDRDIALSNSHLSRDDKDLARPRPYDPIHIASLSANIE